jgi:hypothetical protein
MLFDAHRHASKAKRFAHSSEEGGKGSLVDAVHGHTSDGGPDLASEFCHGLISSCISARSRQKNLSKRPQRKEHFGIFSC